MRSYMPYCALIARFTSRRAAGAPQQHSVSTCVAASSSSSCGTTRVTSPHSHASSAVSVRADSNRSRARAMPTWWGRICA